jgi:phenylpropionate dioxygenase-like ring-hydroxylating dioxygenase large terminal subunit
MTTQLPEFVNKAWHLIALSAKLKVGQSRSYKVAGTSIVLFRTTKGLSAMIDRCPHRNYPLSKGRVVDDHIECPYHGWRFGLDGSCASVPGCVLEQGQGQKLSATTIKVSEHGGGIFVCLDDEGGDKPVLPELFGDPSLDYFWWEQGVWSGRAFDAIENIMDPFHTTHLHHGLIRNRNQQVPVQLLVNSFGDGIEMVIEQNEPDKGLMSQFLEADRVRSCTRYYPPTTSQAIWEGKTKLTLCVTAFFTPVDDVSFRPFACFATPKGLAPSWLKEAAIRLFLWPVIAQDRDALAAQHGVLQEFNAPRYMQGPGDILGPRVHRLWQGQSIPKGSDEAVAAKL